MASVTATANNTAGTYRVTASASGAAAPASFTLTNTKTKVTTLAVMGTSPTDINNSGNGRAVPLVTTDINNSGNGRAVPLVTTDINNSGNGRAVPLVTLSNPGWQSRRLWPAQSIRSLPAQQSAGALVTTRSLRATSH